MGEGVELLIQQAKACLPSQNVRVEQLPGLEEIKLYYMLRNYYKKRQRRPKSSKWQHILLLAEDINSRQQRWEELEERYPGTYIS